MTNHIVCKIIENIASTNSQNVQKFLNNQAEVVNALWTCYTTSSNSDNLRISSLEALSKLISHSTSIFTTLVDKIGPDTVLDCLSHNNSSIQQSILTMISMHMNEMNNKTLPEKVWFDFK